MHAGHREPRGRTRGVVVAAITAALVGLVGVIAAAVLSGAYQVRPVLSGSMRPGLPVGGVVITHRVPVSSLHVRDVVVLHRPDRPDELYVHRIMSMAPGPDGPVVRTQGDANDAPDPWRVTLHGHDAYRAVFSLPWAGYVAVWVHGPDGRRLMLLAGVLMVLVAAGSGLRTRRRSAVHPAPRGEPVGSS